MYRKCLSSRWFVLIPLIVLAMFAFRHHPRVSSFSYSIAIVCIALSIDRCIRFPHGPTGRF